MLEQSSEGISSITYLQNFRKVLPLLNWMEATYVLFGAMGLFFCPSVKLVKFARSSKISSPLGGNQLEIFGIGSDCCWSRCVGLVGIVGRSLPPPADEMAVGWVSGSELFFPDLCLTNRQPNEALSGNRECNQPEVTVITVIDE